MNLEALVAEKLGISAKSIGLSSYLAIKDLVQIIEDFFSLLSFVLELLPVMSITPKTTHLSGNGLLPQFLRSSGKDHFVPVELDRCKAF